MPTNMSPLCRSRCTAAFDMLPPPTEAFTRGTHSRSSNAVSVPSNESEKAAAARKAVVIDDYRRHLFDWMDKNDIAQLVVKFEGYGDSGQVEDVACYDADEKLIIGLPVPKTVRLPARQTADRWDEELRKVVTESRTRSLWTRRWKRSVYYFLELHWGGWEINEGSFGEVAFEARDRKVIVEISLRYIAINDEREEF